MILDAPQSQLFSVETSNFALSALSKIRARSPGALPQAIPFRAFGAGTRSVFTRARDDTDPLSGCGLQLVLENYDRLKSARRLYQRGE